MNDYLYSLGIFLIATLFYLNLRREKKKEKLENNPMNSARVLNSYIWIIALIITSLYFLIR